MKILVCLKQILDPEISPRDFEVDREALDARSANANFVTNIFCENALETALQLRESSEAEITVLTFGPETAEEILRKGLALKADHAARVDSSGVQRTNSDSAALVLSSAVAKLGDFDLIMLGREAGDWGEGRTAGLMAERMSMPFVSFVDTIEAGDKHLTLQRQTDFGRETLTAQLPLVISITNNDANVPRIPKTRDIMLAHRKQITNLTLEDIGLSVAEVNEQSNVTEIVDLFIPERTGSCEFVEGDNPQQKVEAFAQKLRDVLSSI